MTEGERIAAYFCKGESPSQVAQRIDAALAEACDQRVKNMQLVEADVRAEYLRFEQRMLKAEAALAEREAQIAMLREELGFLMQLHGNTTAGTTCHCPRCVRAMRVRDDTNAATRAFVERIQAETRDECARMIEETLASDPMFMGRGSIAAAIRALGEKR